MRQAAAAGATPAVPAAPAHAQAQTLAPIPFKRDSGAGPSIGGSALGIVLVSLLAIAAVLVMRKRLRMNTGMLPVAAGKKLLRILETERMGPSARLSVVEFDGVRYLIGQSEHGMVRLASSPPRSEP